MTAPTCADDFREGLAQEREDARRDEQAERDQAAEWAALDELDRLTTAADAGRDRAQKAAAEERWQRIAGMAAAGLRITGVRL